MTANAAITIVGHVMANLAQSPTPRTAEVARVMQDLQAAQQQAQAAEAQARLAQQQAEQAQQDVQRQVQQDVERAKREIERAIRGAQRDVGRAGRPGQPLAFPPFPGGGPQIPEGAVIMSVAFFMTCAIIAIGVPIARAIARRMDKRSVATAGADPDTRSRLERIEQAVDAIAVEVERISEGQRFTTRVLSDLRALPQPDPSVPVAERVAVPLSRAREAR